MAAAASAAALGSNRRSRSKSPVARETKIIERERTPSPRRLLRELKVIKRKRSIEHNELTRQFSLKRTELEDNMREMIQPLKKRLNDSMSMSRALTWYEKILNMINRPTQKELFVFPVIKQGKTQDDFKTPFYSVGHQIATESDHAIHCKAATLFNKYFVVQNGCEMKQKFTAVLCTSNGFDIIREEECKYGSPPPEFKGWKISNTFMHWDFDCESVDEENFQKELELKLWTAVGEFENKTHLEWETWRSVPGVVWAIPRCFSTF
jgi:hypothetical protein